MNFIPTAKRIATSKDWFEANKEMLISIIELKNKARQLNDLDTYKALRSDLQRECRRAQCRFWNKIGKNIQLLYIIIIMLLIYTYNMLI